MIIHNNIKQLRKSQHISQEQLSKHLNCSRNTVTSWERAVYQPSALQIALLLDYFKCEFFELFYLEL